MNSILRMVGRALFRAFPPIRTAYHALRRRILIIRRALMHARDAVHTYRYMRWEENEENYWKLSAELIFYFHKLEKGLCIPGPKRFFGADPAGALLLLLERWKRRGYATNDPVYLGALECLRAYRARLEVTPPPLEIGNALAQRIDVCLAGVAAIPELATPVPPVPCSGAAVEALLQLCAARRSVRAYREDPVSLNDIYEAVTIAQLSPSACNRQPWRVHIYRDRRQMDAMLALQNGNRGFGHEIPLLLVVTADANGFFDGSERNQPYIDAGLFTMTLLLALQARELATCCLNWCVTDADLDREAHFQGNIPRNEKIVMYIAVGYPAQDALVPRSVRRCIDSFVIGH